MLRPCELAHRFESLNPAFGGSGYRLRWQAELVFKRFKSLAGLGHLPKRDPTIACA